MTVLFIAAAPSAPPLPPSASSVSHDFEVERMSERERANNNHIVETQLAYINDGPFSEELKQKLTQVCHCADMLCIGITLTSAAYRFIRAVPGLFISLRIRHYYQVNIHACTESSFDSDVMLHRIKTDGNAIIS